MKVFISAIKVKFVTSIAMAVLALLIPVFIDISSVSSKEGFITLGILAGVCLVVGILNIRKYQKSL